MKSVSVRGRKVVELDLKDKAAIAQVLDLLANADALIEGFRPGVMERLGLGPDVVLARNPRLVYGRMTGWGQDGPLAHAAGHDINYISITGALDAIGPEGEAGAAAEPGRRFRRRRALSRGRRAGRASGASKSGKGQVVDAAMFDGAASLMSMFFGMTASAAGPKGASRICSTAARISTASMNAPAAISSRSDRSSRNSTRCCASAGLTDADFDAQMDRTAWPLLKEKLTDVFKSKTREEWCKIMEGTDICFAPILTMAEAPKHPHMAARGVFVERHGVTATGPGAALLAHAVGDQGHGESGYRRDDEGVERRRSCSRTCHCEEPVRANEAKSRASYIYVLVRRSLSR